MSGPLAGCKVIDLSWGIAGPLATMFMADYGADVVKVEPPGGDPYRHLLPAYRVWQRGKKSLTLDLKSASGKENLGRLLDDADVLLESYAPGVTDRLGINYAVLSADYPRLVYCSIRGYGHEADAGHAGFDALVQARAGVFGEQAGVREGPVFSYYPLASYGAGYLAAIGTLAALHVRQATGAGQHVDTSLYDGVLAHFALQFSQAEKPTAAFRAFHGVKRHVAPTVDSYSCSDGRFLHIHTGAKGAFERICELVGLDPKDFDGYYKGRHFVGDREQGERFRSELAARFKTRTMMEWVQALREADVAVGPCLAPGEVLDDPQALAMELVTQVNDPELGPITELGLPLKFSATPGAIRGSAVRPGADTEEILSVLNNRDAQGARTRRESKISGSMRHPLEGIRIVDCGMFAAGPYATMFLSDLGADVIKVEPPDGDTMRPTEKAFVGVQRGKRSAAIDLKNPAGLEIFHRLVARADIVQHNLRLAVAERLGIGYEALRRINPKIIYCHGTGYGSKGPLSELSGFEMTYQAHCGLEVAQAGEGNPPVLVSGAPMDLFTAMLSATAMLMALHHRDRTGEGQHIECPQFASGFVFESQIFVTPDGISPRFQLDREQTGFGPFYRIYETRDGGWICVSCPDRERRTRLLDTLGIAADNGGSGPELTRAMEGRFRERNADEWIAAFRKAGVPAEIAQSAGHVEKLLSDPEAIARGQVAENEHPVYQRLRQAGHLIRFSRTPGKIERAAPIIGQHTREVLREADYETAEIDDLEARGVIRCA
jgi:crotonobetainyl-CoA:carnitine CoA-transferase CaiB-like acyl-CoA transferase